MVTNNARTKEIAIIAFHEAGHAVVACLLNIPFTKVKFTPRSKSTHAVVTFRKGPLPAGVDPARHEYSKKAAWTFMDNQIATCLAGPLAETIYTGCWQDGPMDKGTDEPCAWELCKTQTPARKHCSPLQQNLWGDSGSGSRPKL